MRDNGYIKSLIQGVANIRAVGSIMNCNASVSIVRPSDKEIVKFLRREFGKRNKKVKKR